MFTYANQLGYDSVRACLRTELQPEINVQDLEGTTILRYMVARLADGNASADYIDMLLESKADPNLCNCVGESPLMTACAPLGSLDNNRRTIKALLAAKADVNARNEGGASALVYHAEFSTDIEVARMLIDAGIDVNTHGPLGPAIAVCCFEGITMHEGLPTKLNKYARIRPSPDTPIPDPVCIDIPLLQLLITAKADLNCRHGDNRTPLINCCKAIASYGSTFETDQVQILIDAKADVNARSSSDYTALSLMIESKNQNRVSIIKSLLTAGATRGLGTTHISAPHRVSLLGRAISADRLVPSLEVVKLLLDAGAEPRGDIQYPSYVNNTICGQERRGSMAIEERMIPRVCDHTRRGPILVLAADLGTQNSLEIIRALIDSKADVNARDRNGHSALTVAICRYMQPTDPFREPVYREHFLPVIQLLLDRKADVNIYDDVHRRTPLSWAMHYRGFSNRAVIQLLLNSRADPDLVDSYGISPLWREVTRLRDRDDVDTIEILLAARANINLTPNNRGSVLNACSEFAGSRLTQLMRDGRVMTPDRLDTEPDVDAHTVCSLYELFRIYCPRLTFDYASIPQFAINQVRDIDNRYAVWQTIMTHTVLPCIQLHSSKVLLKAGSNRVKLMGLKYGSSCSNTNLKLYYSIYDEASLQTRLAELDTVL